MLLAGTAPNRSYVPLLVCVRLGRDATRSYAVDDAPYTKAAAQPGLPVATEWPAADIQPLSNYQPLEGADGALIARAQEIYSALAERANSTGR